MAYDWCSHLFKELSKMSFGSFPGMVIDYCAFSGPHDLLQAI